MGKILKLGIVLFIITAVTGMILGGVYTITLKPIKVAKERETVQAMTETLPGATAFEYVGGVDNPGLVTAVSIGMKGDELVGWNYTVMPKGYGGLLEILVGVSKEGRLMAIKILNHSETPGLGAKAATEPFLAQFREKTVDRLAVTKADAASESEIHAISGATITSRAVAQGVNAALAYFNEHQSDSPKKIETDGTTSASQQESDTEEHENR